jgi:tetratricopeptide (TPR) repeat protein
MKRAVFIVAVVWGGGVAGAGLFPEGERGPLTLDGGPSVRARSLGSAYVALSDDPGGADWNPAGLQAVARPEASWNYAREVLGRTEQSVAWVRPVWVAGSRRTWGLQTKYAGDDALTLMEEGEVQGTLHPREWVLGASYGFRFAGVDLGARIQGVDQRVSVSSHRGIVVDMGVLGTAASRWRWGAALANLGRRLSHDGPRPPTAVRVGAARRLGSATWLTAESDWTDTSTPALALGVETAYRRGGTSFLFRGGYRARSGLSGASRFSLGAGVDRGRFRWDYGFFPSSDLAAQHRVEWGWRWGGPLAAEVAWRGALDRARAAMDQGRWLDARGFLAESDRLSPGSAESILLAREIDRRLEESLDPDTLYHIGRDRAARGDDEEAAVFLRRWALLRPEADPSLLREVEGRLAATRTARLREKMARDAAKERVRLKALTERYQREESWAEALASAESWAGLGDDEGRSRRDELRRRARDLAREAAERGEWADALRWERLAGGGSPDAAATARIREREKKAADEAERRARTFYEDGVRAYREGRRQEARELFDRALTLSPGDPAVLRARERLLKELEEGAR